MATTGKNNFSPGKRKNPARKVPKKTVRWEQAYGNTARLIRKLVNRVWGQYKPLLRANDVDEADLRQIGALAVGRAAKAFDPQRGASFGTLAYHAVQSALADEVKRCKRPKNRKIPVSLNRLSTRKKSGGEEREQRYALVPDKRILVHRPSELSDPHVRASLVQAIHALSIPQGSQKPRLKEKHAEIVLDRFGLLDGHSYTIGELAEKYGIKKLDLSTILWRTLGVIRKSPSMQRYRDFLVEK